MCANDTTLYCDLNASTPDFANSIYDELCKVAEMPSEEIRTKLKLFCLFILTRKHNLSEIIHIESTKM